MKNRILSLLLALSMVLPGTLSAVSLLSPAPARAADGATTHYKFTPSNSAVTDHTKLNTNLSWGTDSLRTKAIANAPFTMYLPTGPVNGRYFRMYNSAGTDSTEEHSVKMTQDEYHYGLPYRAWGFDYETKVKDEQGNETTVKKTAYYKAATESLEITLQNFSPLDTTGIKAANLSMMVLQSTLSNGVNLWQDRRLEVKVSLDGETWLDGSASVRSATLIAGTTSNMQLFRIETENLLDIPGVAGNTIHKIKLLPDGEDVSSRGNVYFNELSVNTYKTVADFDRLVPAEEITYTSVSGDTLRQIAVEEGVRTASVEWESDAEIKIYSPAGSSTGATTASAKTYSANTTYRGPVYERTSDSSRELFQSLLDDGTYDANEAKLVTSTLEYDKVYTSEHPYGMDCQTFVFNAISRVSRTNAWAVAYTPHATRATLLDGLTPLTHPIYTDHDIINPTKTAKGEAAVYQHYAKAKAGDIAISYLSNQNNSVHTRLVTEVKVVESNGAIDAKNSYMRFTEQTGSDVYAYRGLLDSTVRYSTSKPTGLTYVLYKSHSRTGQEKTYSFSDLLSTGYVVYTLDEYQTGQVEDVKIQAVAGSKTADTDFANGGLNLAVCSNYRIIKRHVTLKAANSNEVLFDSRTDDPNFDEYYIHYFPVGFNYQNDDLDLMLQNLPNGDYTITVSVDSGPFTSLSQTTVPTNTVDFNFTVNRDNICDTDNDGIYHESGLGWTELNEAWFDGRTQASNGAYNLPAGKYYLAKDLTVPNNGALSLAANAVLCLNGYDLKLLPSGTNNSILVNNKTHLTLCDCAGTGTIQAGDAETSPGTDGNGLYALYVAPGGQVDMYGGTITNTYARYGSVYIGTTSQTPLSAVMNLYGGGISGNTSPKYFGGVSLNYGGVFNMYGGTISNNSGPTYSSGLYMINDTTANIYGGTITGCESPATIFVSGNATLNMLGGSITGNTSTQYDAVYVASGVFNMSDGTISDNTIPSGYSQVGCASGSGTFVQTGGTVIATSSTASGICGPNLTWSLYKSGELSFDGTGTMYDWSNPADVPWYSNRNAISKVTIPSGVTNIGDYAFAGYTSLTQTTIADSVESIGAYAFYECTGLTEITIPDNVTTIGSHAFFGCTKLAKAAIGPGVLCIGSYAFYNCNGLTAVTIPDNTDIIGSYAFGNCTGLTTVTIPNRVTTIGSDAFSNCTSLASATIGSGVTTAGESLFSGCTALTTVTFAPGLTQIWDNAFTGHTALTTVSIPGSVTNIGVSAFAGCTNLTTAAIPNGVTNIGENAFSDCSALTSVTIPASVSAIGSHAFSNCTGLNAVTMENGVTDIGHYAFSNCTGLTTVTIPDSVLSVGSSAFSGCEKLTAVSIGAGVANIGQGAFSDCDGLRSFTVANSNTAYSSADGVLFNKTQTKLIQYAGTGGTYTVPNGVTEIQPYAFAGRTDLTSVTLPNGLTEVADHLFCDCTGLVSVSIPNSVTKIGSNAFRNCTSLVEAAIPDNLTKIDSFAFYNCEGLTEVEIPDTIVAIGNSAFYGCTDLNRVSFQGNAPSEMDATAFANCDSILTLYCPGNATGWTDSEHYDAAANTWYGYSLYVIDLYSVSVVNAANGVISVDTTEGKAGTTVTITATPDEGYYLQSLLVDGEAISGYTFTIGGDHTVTAVFAKQATFYGASVVLGDTLDMTFYVAKSNVPDSGSYAKIVRTYADDRADDVRIIPMSQWTTSGNYYKIVYDGLAAKEMCDEINITIYNSYDSAISYTWTDSIRTYVMRMVDRADQKSARTVFIDLLNYGAAAQQTFTYATDNLANSLLTPEHQADATQSVTCEDQRVKTDNVYGSSLGLESKIVLNFYFTGMTDGMYAQVSYTDYLGKTVSYRAEYEDFEKNNKAYLLSVDQLAVADGSTLVTCTVYNADGSQYASVTDSMTSYLARFISSYPWFEDVAKFISSTYDYMTRNK